MSEGTVTHQEFVSAVGALTEAFSRAAEASLERALAEVETPEARERAHEVFRRELAERGDEVSEAMCMSLTFSRQIEAMKIEPYHQRE